MKKHLLLFIILILVNSLVKAQDGADYCSEGKIKSFSRLSKLSSVQYPGDSNIDVTYYKLDLRVNTNPNSLNGIVTVKAKAATQNLITFYLDLVNALTVSSVKLNGNALTFSQANNQLTIILNRQYSLGEEFSVDIIYSGVPTSGTGSISSARFLFYDQTANKQVVATLSQPYGARDWWPSKDTPADKADSSDVWITADKFFVSVSNGSLEATVDNPDGTRTYKWKNHYPIANYLISIAMTNYQTIDDQFEYQTGKFLPVIHYSYPERLDNTRRTAVAKTIEMLRIFSEKFGPYPYLKEKYGHAEFSWGGGMEHQTITSMGGGAMNSESTIAHELAHQWYGDKVTCKNWQNIWLNEGFATYCEKIYWQYKYDQATFNSRITSMFSSAKTAQGTIYVQNINSENEIFNGARSYNKGGSVLHMLRGIVGDDKFFQLMREFANEPGLAYNVATTEDFQRIAERVSGMNLNYFFQEWIYGEGYPNYTVEKNIKQLADGSYQLTFRLKQDVKTNPSFFTMPVRLRITLADAIWNTTLFNNQQDQSWVIPLGKTFPSSIEFDPDNWILKDIVTNTSVDKNQEVPTTFSLSQNYPNPFNPSTVISWQLAVSTFVNLRIYDLLGREVATLVDEFQQAGFHNSTFNTQNWSLTSGVYFYTFQASDYIETKKMILIK
ncbi:MAG: M1 family aminopeptidase [Melioribacteraceae bacterium]